MTVIVRFAPSPTGLLHVGNARMALINYLYARAHDGQMILRLDDTDRERSTEESADAIKTDLTWMGIKWDRLEKQSDRMALYEEAFEKLKAQGRVYACYETPDELDTKRKRLLARHKPPIYDRGALDLTDDDKAKLETEGRKPHWRFKLNHADINFDDLVRGPVHFHGANVSDPVLVRADGTFLYMLPSAVDDIEMGITHVLRGEDHVSNTAIQTQIFEALGAACPTFGHLPLLTDISGEGLSKRLGSIGLQSLREDGFEAMALNNVLSHMGTSDAMVAHKTIEDLAKAFNIGAYGRASPKFDPDQLKHANMAQVHGLTFAEAKPRLDAMGLTDADEIFWNAIRPNLEKLIDAKGWYDIVHGLVTPVIEDAGFAAKASALLPKGEWDAGTWKAWTNAVKEETGAKGRNLFMPLRQALTGMDHGPELGVLLPLIGPEKTRARLNGETA